MKQIKNFILVFLIMFFILPPCFAKDKVRVLSLDGGGIKSLITLKMLAYIEEGTGKKTGELFDYIAGCSSGGMLTLYLTMPKEHDCHKPAYSANQIIELFQEDSRIIFREKVTAKCLTKPAVQLFSTPYNLKTMMEMTTNRFKQYRMRDAVTDIFVLTFDTETNMPIPFTNYDGDYNPTQMSTVAAATSVAPFYFSPIDYYDKKANKHRTLIDGGLVAKNPSVFAYGEAKKRNPNKDILMVSLGAGYQEKYDYNYDKLKNWGFLKYSLPTYTFMLDGVTNTNDLYMSNIEQTDKTLRYFRLQPRLDKKDGFDNRPDNTDQANFDILLRIGDQYVLDHKAELDKIIKELNEENKTK
ncbi:MAG: patatin-like phospholipase family protein [Candidatus Gastranaerophilales bacterium]|nr:patatin-like phospholipase family protein [Candidatus Gastranaerophilales bacterium]